MIRYLIRFSYIGTKYKGLQKVQTGCEDSVQGVLEEALKTLNPANEFLTSTCSRTDKGVHALCNYLHVDLEHKTAGETFIPYLVTQRLNHYLETENHEIIVTKTCVVPDNFHVRFCTKWRNYVYRLAVLKTDIAPITTKCNNYNEFLPICERNRCFISHCKLDMDKICETMRLYEGTHDFSTFTRCLSREKRNPVKTIYEAKFCRLPNANFISDPMYNNVDLWEFCIKGDSFLYNQVRKLVGTALAVGHGVLSLDDVKAMFVNPSPQKWINCILVPACGLYLADIQFDKKYFDVSTDSNLRTTKHLNNNNTAAETPVVEQKSALVM